MLTRPGTAVYNPPGTSYGIGAMWDPGIHTLTDLAAVSTVNLLPGAIRAWIQASDGTNQIWRLLTSSQATVNGSIQQPADYNATNNPKVWFKASS